MRRLLLWFPGVLIGVGAGMVQIGMTHHHASRPVRIQWDNGHNLTCIHEKYDPASGRWDCLYFSAVKIPRPRRYTGHFCGEMAVDAGDTWQCVSSE